MQYYMKKQDTELYTHYISHKVRRCIQKEGNKLCCDQWLSLGGVMRGEFYYFILTFLCFPNFQ